jgi:ATP-dependent exoDNAse (exonuclease V) beta subunit
VDAFLRFARETTVAAGGATRALNVMTVHKSKGLEFDVVILPDLVITSLDNDSRSDVLLWQRGGDGEVAWLLNRPPKVVVEWDGRLTGEIERLKARGGFEGLCRLYVAMTRAKRGLYVLIDSKGNARSEAKIVRDALAGTVASREDPIPGVPAVISLYERGERDWFEKCEMLPAPATPPAAAVAAKTIVLGAKLRELGQPPRRRAPSGEESFRIRGAELLSPQRESSRGFGTLVHRLFAEIEWIEDLDDAALETKWRNAGLAAMEGFERAKEMVRQTLARDEVRSWFTNIGGARQAWRERSFDLMADREWISGQIDRVILERDGKGRFTAATVLDFKTDNVSSEADMKEKIEGYAPQVTLYRTAVARLTGLPAKSVRAALIFTTQKEWRWVSDAKA